MSISGTTQARTVFLATVALAALAPQAARARPIQSVHYDIAAQDLGSALTDLGRQSNREIRFDAALTRGKRAPRLRGSMSVERALDQLLAGSGLRYRIDEAQAIIIDRGDAGRRAADNTVSSGQAIDPPSADSQGIDIVVTANKREERAIDVANSVTAITEDSLLRRNLTRIEEFAAQVPGLSLRSGINGGVQLILRGQNTGGAGATAAATVDDSPLSYSSANGGGSTDTANIDTFDIERIEVLRGPQGTLYGSAAEGGLLKYVINKPKFDRTEGRLEGGVEGIDGGGIGGSVRGSINLPIVSDKLAFRASGFYYKTPGYIDNPLIGRTNINDGERYGGRVALAWRPVDDLTLRLTGLRQVQDYNGYGVVETLGSHASPATPPANFLTIANGGVLTRNTLISEYNRRAFNLYDGHIDWALPFVDFASITSYGEINTTYRLDNTNFALGGPNTIGTLFGARYGQPIVAASDPTFTLQKFSQEARFSSKPAARIGGIPFELQAGFFYTQETVNVVSITNALSAANTSQILTTPQPLGGTLVPSTYREYSGFGEGTLHLLPKLSITGGVRYTTNEQSLQSTTLGGLLTGPSIVRPAVFSNEDKVTWNGAIRYAIADRASLYARVASGYRPGGPIAPIPGAPADFPTAYRADNTVNYEVGFKGDLFDRLVSVDVTAFWIDWTDIQINSFFTSAISGLRFATTGNAGTAVSRGIEYSVAVRPLRGLQISAVGSYVDAKLTVDAPAFGGRNGDVLPYVPDFSNTLNVDYSAKSASGIRYFAGGSWQYVSRRYSDFGTSAAFSNHVRIPGYGSVNLQLGADIGRFTLEAYARNIGDSRGITRYQGGNGFAFTDTVDVIVPRTFGGRVTVRF